MSDIDLIGDRTVQHGMARAVCLGYIVEFMTTFRGIHHLDLLTRDYTLLERRTGIPRTPADVSAVIDELLKDLAPAAGLEGGRWGFHHGEMTWQTCRYCGTASHTHAPTVCLACASPQCRTGRECHICLRGLVKGMFYGHPLDATPPCGYTGCGKEAAAQAPRVKHVCRDHLSKPTRRFRGRTITLAEDITERVAMLGQRRSPYCMPGYHRQTLWYPN